MARLALVREQISSIEKTRAERLERAPDTGPHAMVRLLARVIGIGYAILVAALAFAWQFALFRTSGFLWALFLASPLVPLIDWRWPGEKFNWRREAMPGNAGGR